MLHSRRFEGLFEDILIIIFSLSKAVVCNYLYHSKFIQGNLTIFELNFKINRVAGEIGILVLLVTSGMIKTNFEII